MNHQHKQLANGRWLEFSFSEQMANIGSEVERAISWRNKDKEDFSQRAYERALELLGLTIGDKKNLKRLKELARLREALNDFFVFDNQYNSTDRSWQNYFLGFNFAARSRN